MIGRTWKRNRVAKKKNNPPKRPREEAPKAREVADVKERKRAKRKALEEFRNLSLARERVAMDEVKDEMLEVKDERVYCKACNKYIKFELPSDVRQHCFGRRGGRKAKNHPGNVEAFREQVKRGAVIDSYVQKEFKEGAKATANGPVFNQGSTLAAETLRDRAVVLRSLWVCGIPLNKLDHSEFLALIENPHLSLGGRAGVRDMQAAVVCMLQDEVVAAVKDKQVSIFFDGSKVNSPIEGVLARYLDEEYRPVQVCIGVSAVPKTMNQTLLKATIEKHLGEAKIHIKNVVGAISDSGQPNPAMMNLWNLMATDLFFGDQLDDHQLLFIPCLMHAFSNCGKILRKSLPQVRQFMSGFKTMTNESAAARLLWLEVTGKLCPRLADKSFWAWWIALKEILLVWDKLGGFFVQAKKRGIARKSVEKMSSTWSSCSMLREQMTFCRTFGQIFHDAGQTLEGDGFCLSFVQGFLSTILELKDRMRRARHDDILIIDACKCGAPSKTRRQDVLECQELLSKAAEDVFVQFDRAILNEMKTNLPLFQAAGLFNPNRFLVEAAKPAANEAILGLFDTLLTLKGLRLPSVELRNKLAAELVVYTRLCKQFQQERFNSPNQLPLSPSDVWNWWRAIRTEVPGWFEVAKVLILLQPSSACIERFFSVVKANSSDQQALEHFQTLAYRSMAIYNEGTVARISRQ